MALPSLLSGADCSAQANPLAQLLKTQEDQARSLRHDGFGGAQAGPSGLRTQQTMASPDADAQRFFARQPLAHQFGPQHAHAEAMSHGHAAEAEDMARMEHLFAQHQLGPQPANATQDWRAAYAAEQQRTMSPTMGQQPAAMNAMPQQSQYRRSPMPFYGGAGGGGMMYRSAMQQYEGKGKAREESRFVELDDATWDAEFARRVETDAQTADATATVPDSLEELDARAEAAMEEAMGEDDDAFAAELEKTWRNLRGTLDGNTSVSDAELAAWEAEYGVQRGMEFEDGADEVEPFDPRLLDQPARPFGHSSDTMLAPYEELQDPFAEGQRLLAEGAPLREASLAFEAATKRDPTRGEAWRALGDTLASDEKEMRAIEALEIAARCPGAGQEDAWLSLAISYVNEGQEQRALATLERWISITYPDIVARQPPLPSASAKTDPWAGSRRVIELFMAAARTGPAARSVGGGSAEGVDPDVQVGLGVLFYSDSDYTHARDCFEAALASRPNDPLLWNRLGATLANGGNPELAIDAYRKALELRPTLTRVVYNLGVSCLNVGCFKEAAEHLLSALELHRSGRGSGTDSDGSDGSASLYYTLRRAFLCMERHDLADKARPGTDVDVFRSEFDF